VSGKKWDNAAEVMAAAQKLGLGEGQFDVERVGNQYALRAIGDPAIEKIRQAGYKGIGEQAMVTFAQAGVVARTYGAERLRRLNVARGEMRAGADLAQYLRYDSKEPLIVPAGGSHVGAISKAHDLGLKRGEYKIAPRGKGEGGYQIEVAPENISKIARPHSIKTSQRAVEKQAAIEEVNDRIASLGEAGAYHDPMLQDGTEIGPDGKAIPPMILQAHQIMGAEMIDKFKHEILNYGPGCIHADTEIPDPVRGETRTVKEWMDAGIAPHVWALDEESGEVVIGQASVPFIKSYEPMFVVTLDTEETITVAAGHLFLAPEGWKQLRGMEVGQIVAVPNAALRQRIARLGGPASEGRADHASSPDALETAASLSSPDVTSRPPEGLPAGQPVSSSAGVLSALTSGAGCYSDAGPGFPGGCRRGSRSGGGRLPSGADGVPGGLPSRDDARGHSRAGCTQGGRDDGAGRSPVYLSSVHLSTWDDRDRAESPPGGWAIDREWCASSGWCSSTSPGWRQSDDPANLRQRGSGVSPRSVRAATLGRDWARIVSVRPMGRSAVYDLEVARYHNYITSQAVSHNTGKTFIYYAAMSKALQKNPKMRGIMTMPAKPKVQQENYQGDEWRPSAGPNGQGGWVENIFTGEKVKALKDEMANRIHVVHGKKDLMESLARVDSGELNFLVVSPDMMRDYQDQFAAHHFMDEKGTAFYADEAHEYAVGTGKRPAGEETAARRFAKAEYVVLGSGTLVTKSGSELQNLVDDFIAPGELGSKSDFDSQWQRLAEQRAGGGGEFTPEKVTAMRQMLSPYMTSFHKPPKRAGGQGEYVKQDSAIRVVDVDAATRDKILQVNKDFEAQLASPIPDKRKSAALERDGKVNRALLGAVVDQVADEVQKYISEPTKAGDTTLPGRVLVWGQETDKGSPMAKFKAALAEKIGQETARRFPSITGSDSEKATNDAARKLNDFGSDTPGATISNSANYGMNLQGASHVLMLGIPSTEQRQIIARALRKGQRRDVVHVVNYITNHLYHELTLHRTLKEREAAVGLLEELQDQPKPKPQQQQQAVAKSLYDQHYWITPEGKSIAIAGDHESWLTQHRRDRIVRQAFQNAPRGVPEMPDNYDVEDFARSSHWSRARHSMREGNDAYVYSLPDNSKRTFDAVQLHHLGHATNDKDVMLQVARNIGIGTETHYYQVLPGETDWKEGFERARMAGMTKAMAGSVPARRNSNVMRTPEQQANRIKTERALLSDETGAGKILLRHWGTIVAAAKGAGNADAAEGGVFGPHRLNSDEFGKSGRSADHPRPIRFTFSRRAARSGDGQGLPRRRPAGSAAR
jgi:hypothetical protein